MGLNHSVIFSLLTERLTCSFTAGSNFAINSICRSQLSRFFIMQHFDEHNISLSYLNYYCSTPFETSVQWDLLML
jgi:hypothetical protein